MKKIQIKRRYALYVFLILLSSLNTVYAQNGLVTGIVLEKNTSEKSIIPLPGASIFWLNTTIGTSASTDGSFKLETPASLPAKLVISFVGYSSDTITIEKPGKVKVFLKPSISLGGVTVEGRQESTMISTIKPINIEQINQKELLKAACCNLSESFETNASVNVSYTDAITGAKEIQMLGLSGIYSQIMTEAIPSIRGLAATYGLAYIPGPWMESIQITKGSGSVANGFESTTGQINVEYLKPEEADNFYLNGYAASSGNVELNAHKTIKVSEQTKGLLMIHGEHMPVKWDHQDDGFLDMPLVSNVNVLNRWSIRSGNKFEGQFGVKALMERRRSGQSSYQWGDKADTTTGYGVQIKTARIEAFSKTGLIFPETPWKSAGLILSGSFHKQESYFGLKKYDGMQSSFYGSLIYMSIISNTQHKWKTGLDMRYDDYQETFLLFPYNRVEAVPGVFAEYTLNWREKIGIVAGSRLDYHNDYGLFYTPRLHMKYNFTPELIFRLSGGRSFRTANVFADNISIMATSRNLVITEKLNPERAWNAGANFTAKFTAFYRPGSISLDYYMTDFTNQVIVDAYSSEDKILIYNLEGTSYSKSFQVAFNYEVFKRFDLRLAYKNDDVFLDYMGVSSHKPLVPENRALLNIGYSSRKDEWRYDFTTHYQGTSALALANEDNANHPGHGESQITNNKSPEFFTFNAQITRIFKKWEVYLGCENLSDFRQEHPVINPENPFGPGFDATNVWGPVMGRKVYAGFRYTLKNKK